MIQNMKPKTDRGVVIPLTLFSNSPILSRVIGLTISTAYTGATKVKKKKVVINVILSFFFIIMQTYIKLNNFPIPSISRPRKLSKIGIKPLMNIATTALIKILFPSFIFSGSSVLSMMPA